MHQFNILKRPSFMTAIFYLIHIFCDKKVNVEVTIKSSSDQ